MQRSLFLIFNSLCSSAQLRCVLVQERCCRGMSKEQKELDRLPLLLEAAEYILATLTLCTRWDTPETIFCAL